MMVPECHEPRKPSSSLRTSTLSSGQNFLLIILRFLFLPEPCCFSKPNAIDDNF
uniref:Uncharacterized protein n=1 Tax=Rhizophora mucronata TaxID=61149 RepID=A0A2P2QB47_RHIMU